MVCGICCRMATDDLIVYGERLMISAMIIMNGPPVNTGKPNTLLLKVTIRATPITDPGMMYGIMVMMSRVWLNRFFLLTTRYAHTTDSSTTSNSALTAILMVFQMVSE